MRRHLRGTNVHPALAIKRAIVAKKASPSGHWMSNRGFQAPKTVRSRGAAKHTYDHEFFKIEVYDAENIIIILKTFDDSNEATKWRASMKDGKIKYRDASEDPLNEEYKDRYIIDEDFIPASIRAEVERIAKAKSFL